MKDVSFPGWAQFLSAVLIILPMIPVFAWLLKDLILNPMGWFQGFKNKFTNPHEYHPDPSMVDPSRRKTPEETEEYILTVTKIQPTYVEENITV